MKIKERDKLPDAKVFILDKDPKEVSIKQIIGGEKTFRDLGSECVNDAVKKSS